MNTLDCESLGYTFASLQRILGVAEAPLRKLFDSHPHIEDELSNDASHWDDHDVNMPGQLLLRYIQESTGCELRVDYVVFFHCTRSEPGVKPQDGLLPRSMVEKRVWDKLYTYVQDELSREEWKNLRAGLSTGGIGGRLGLCYAAKCVHPDVHDGPYAYLVRDVPVAIHRKCDNTYVDYFETPEMVEEICEACEQVFQIDLLARFREQTKPSIVKFRHLPSSDEATKCISGALLYAYHKHHGCSLNGGYHHFDAGGTTVGPDCIERIEWLEDME